MLSVLIQKGHGSEALDEIQTEWKELFALSDASPFMRWEWMSVWFKNFAKDRTQFILKAYRDGTLIGILPLFFEKKGVFGLRVESLCNFGTGPGGADHLDIITRPEDKSDGIKAVLKFLSDSHYCDQISLENLPAGSATAELLKTFDQTTSGSLSRVTESVTAVCPQIDLSEGWDSVLNESKRSDNFKRRLRKLEKMAGFEYRSIISPDETASALDRFVILHQKRWENAGGSELSGHPRLIAFQRQIVAEMSFAGAIRFDELWLEGRCVSSVYGLDDGKTFYYFNSGYDLDYSNFSVGLVLLGLSVKHAVDRGCKLYDFLRGDEQYKFDWANRRTNLTTVSLSRNTLPLVAYELVGRSVESLRQLSKSALPSSTSEILGSWRRAWKRNYEMR